MSISSDFLLCLLIVMGLKFVNFFKDKYMMMTSYRNKRCQLLVSNHGSYYFAEINFHDFSRPN